MVACVEPSWAQMTLKGQHSSVKAKVSSIIVPSLDDLSTHLAGEAYLLGGTHGGVRTTNAGCRVVLVRKRWHQTECLIHQHLDHLFIPIIIAPTTTTPLQQKSLASLTILAASQFYLFSIPYFGSITCSQTLIAHLHVTPPKVGLMFQTTNNVVIIVGFVDEFLGAQVTGVRKITCVLAFMLVDVATSRKELTTVHARVLAFLLPTKAGRLCFTRYPPLQREHNKLLCLIHVVCWCNYHAQYSNLVGTQSLPKLHNIFQNSISALSSVQLI